MYDRHVLSALLSTMAWVQPPLRLCQLHPWWLQFVLIAKDWKPLLAQQYLTNLSLVFAVASGLVFFYRSCRDLPKLDY